VRLGDAISVTRGNESIELKVKAISDKRGRASDAKALYEESVESIAARATRAALHKSRALDNPAPEKRPDKRSRRNIIRFTKRGDI
jgi:ribosome-associated heat shock protein Hsp15